MRQVLEIEVVFCHQHEEEARDSRGGEMRGVFLNFENYLCFLAA